MKQIEIQKKNLEESIQSLKAMIAKETNKYEREKKVLVELIEGLKGEISSNQLLSKQINSIDNENLTKLKALDNELEELNQYETELYQRQNQTHRKNLEKIRDIFQNFERLKGLPV